MSLSTSLPLGYTNILSTDISNWTIQHSKFSEFADEYLLYLPDNYLSRNSEGRLTISVRRIILSNPESYRSFDKITSEHRLATLHLISEIGKLAFNVHADIKGEIPVEEFDLRIEVSKQGKLCSEVLISNLDSVAISAETDNLYSMIEIAYSGYMENVRDVILALKK